MRRWRTIRLAAALRSRPTARSTGTLCRPVSSPLCRNASGLISSRTRANGCQWQSSSCWSVAVLGDEKRESTQRLCEFSLECDVAPRQLLLLDRIGHERPLQLGHALFRCTEPIRELSFRAPKERIPRRCFRLRALARVCSRRMRGPSVRLWLEVRGVLAEEHVRLCIPRDRAVAQSCLRL